METGGSSTQGRPPFRPIAVGEQELAFTLDGERRSYPRAALPETFLQWVIQGRRAMYDLLEGRHHASFFGSHLPVVVTSSRHGLFPFNTSNKGVGLAPVPGRIDAYCRRYLETVEATAGLDWQASLPERLRVVRDFIDGPDISDRVLVSLEIFEKSTFANLCDYPIATLHYAGDGPVYRSFQINAVVEVAPPEHPLYRFAFLSRRLFEFDAFHITQTHFPYAYVFHPVEVLDKTPYPRRDGQAATPKEWAEMTLVWDEMVLEQLVRAPTFVQSFIIRTTEDFARRQGRDAVDLDLFNTVRAQYMRRGEHTEEP